MTNKTLINHLRALLNHESFCVRGCSACCEDKPWSWTWEEWGRIPNKKYAKPGDPCPYSTFTGCSIYEERPIICRIVGLYQGLWGDFTFRCYMNISPKRGLSFEELTSYLNAYLSIVMDEREQTKKQNATPVLAGPYGISLLSKK